MAITNITISQTNEYNGSNLLPVHSPLIFKADATYTGTPPDVLLLDIINDGEVLGTYKCIPGDDLTASVRQFIFIADGLVKGFMSDFDDTSQLNETFQHIPEMTKVLDVKFYDPEDDRISDIFTATFVHGASQFGGRPNFEGIYNNTENFIFLGPKDGFTYVYFYNSDPANILTIGNPVIESGYALDYDGSIFTDDNNDKFTINTTP